MLAKAGVTTTLDVAGLPDEMISGYRQAGSGLTVGYIFPLIPGKTVSSANPSLSEIKKAMSKALERGALGVKVLGGHYPLTPEATRNVIEVAKELNCWVAVHAGTTESSSDINGFEELIELAGDNPVHLAHINSYCRGTVTDPLEEAQRAIAALKNVPNCCSESYLAPINGTLGVYENGDFKSNVTKRALTHGGYSLDMDGMKQAILDGWAQVHYHDHELQEIILAPPEQGLAEYNKHETNVYMSFAVNSPVSAIPIALAKDDKGQFIVDALATDGGAIPRNVTLRQGLCLAKYGAFSLNELAHKACYKPAQLLGLENKGHLSVGADADVIVADSDADKPEFVIANGQVIVENNTVTGKGGQFISFERGAAFYNNNSIDNITVQPEWLG
jgi:hypothetical protein